MKKRFFLLSVLFSFLTFGSTYFPQFYHFYKVSLGAWSRYEFVDNVGNKGIITISVVSKENDNYWIEVESKGSSEIGVVAYLTKGDPTDDENVLKIRIKSEGGPIIEIDKETLNKMKQSQKITPSFSSFGPSSGKIHLLKNEKVKVGDKNLECQRIKLEGESGSYANIWLNDNVLPFGVVKLVSENESLMLIDYGSGAKMKLEGKVVPLVIEGEING